MRIHNLGGSIREGSKGWLIEILPDTNGPKTRSLRVALSRELNGEIPERADVGKVGQDKKMLMLFPEKRKDDRHLVIGGFKRPRHRRFASVKEDESTGQILDQSSGYGAWGAGVAFIAILEEGQRIVSSNFRVIWIENGEAKEGQFEKAEYLEWVGKLDNVEIL